MPIKKMLFQLAGLLMFTLQTIAGDVPAGVQKAFDLKFPGAQTVKWDKENAHEYEATFVWNGARYSANFSDTGDWLETESPMTFTQIPVRVQEAFNKTYNGVIPKSVSKIETSKNTVEYEVEFNHGKETIELFYGADGTKIGARTGF